MDKLVREEIKALQTKIDQWEAYAARHGLKLRYIDGAVEELQHRIDELKELV